MKSEHDTRTRIVVSWLREDAHENAERVLLAALNEIDYTQQRRSWWPAWRFSDMNNFAKVLVATAAVAVVAVVGINLLPGSLTGAGGTPPRSSPSTPLPSPSASPNPTPQPTLVAYEVQPCCTERLPRYASMTFAIMAPPSWEPWDDDASGLVLGVTAGWDTPTDGDEAFVGLYPGGNLYSDPCTTAEDAAADVPVGPSVDDLVTALVHHPSLDVTAPVDVTLAGYSGKYLDLTVPNDISKCVQYRPMDRHIYAQGPGQRWHMWILDVDGVRVVVETNDYAGTPADWLAEEPAIVNSLVITP
jgi:hypothetical protein